MKKKKNTVNSAGTKKEQRKLVKIAADLFDEHGHAIRAVIRSQVNNQSEVDDIFQNFFLELVRKPVPPHVQNVRRYLYRAVKNDVLDLARRNKCHNTRLLKYAQCKKSLPPQVGPPEKLILSEEIHNVFQTINTALRTHEADAIFYRYREGESTTGAAERMGINTRSLSRYLCIGLKELRTLLVENEDCMHELCLNDKQAS